MTTKKRGRPPLTGPKADKRVQLRVTSASYAAWVKVAGPRGLSRWLIELAEAALEEGL